ncbi:mannosyltransferase [Mycolicibacterium sp. 050158]|uniref:mannosyltransferase n=1 Tax=Mycolicibacterium sp. 050158 TaxID=3090602 RepID=UPI00299F0380|nr:mannosyltransferase [Mycolicibacterium sp. 050158]MDX1892780.1 mannosyltransferase [Mycolicibacterium sp. 050158]
MTDTGVRADRRRLLPPLLLLLSAGILLGVTIANPPDLVDLHVYVLGGSALDRPDTLYTFVYADQSPDQPLPFVYPPFAAIAFWPLSLLPFVVAGLLWQVATLAAVYGIVRISQRLVGGGTHRAAMLWTAGLIWLEPVRVSLDLGQVGVFLTLVVLYAVYDRRWWVSGLLVGLAAGIKLTPAITGLYFVGMRRWGAAVFSAVVFFATVGLSLLVVGDQVRNYFTRVMGDTSVNPIGIAINQSWRGGISRIVGHDAGSGSLVLTAIAGTAVLAFLAWRALGGGPEDRDRLGSVLIVELFGLLVSPISWVHHWVWVVPLVIWLFCGPWRGRPGARVVGWGWLAITFLSVPSMLALAEPSLWQISRPWYLAWAGLVYVVAAVATLAWIVVTGRRVTTEAPVASGGLSQS